MVKSESRSLKGDFPTTNRTLRWIGALVLFLVAYIHIALSIQMITSRLGILFLINGIGALIAMIGVLKNASFVGWILGIVISGGAASAKLAMNGIPRVRSLLMGAPPRVGGFRPPSGTGGTGTHHFAHMGPGPSHGFLPLFLNIGTLGTVSIFIEFLFVLLAIYVLVQNRKHSSEAAR